jgi:S1-C subfamily serine protease
MENYISKVKKNLRPILLLAALMLASSICAQPKIEIFNNDVIVYKGEISGYFQLVNNGTGKKAGLIVLRHSITTKEKNEIYNWFKKKYSSPSIKLSINLITKYIWSMKEESERFYSVKKELERLKKELERLKKEQTDNFLDYVYTQFDAGISDPEGIYKSIDESNGFEYDVLILKSPSSTDHIGYLINTTDPELEFGTVLFVLKATAVNNKYFLEYRLKSGKIFTNKVATIAEGIFTAGIKSFLKIYPHGHNLKRPENIPSVNWVSSGSGYILNSAGFIATNYHVIKGFSNITVKIFKPDYSFAEKKATIYAYDTIADLAILKIDTATLDITDISFSYSDDIKLGMEVFSLGFPAAHKFGEWAKLNRGIVSSPFGLKGGDVFFQSDLPLWYGNSGGPCLNSKGQLLGLTTMITFDRGTKVENVSFISRSKNIAQLLKGIEPLKAKEMKTTTDKIDFDNEITKSVFISCY